MANPPIKFVKCSAVLFATVLAAPLFAQVSPSLAPYTEEKITLNPFTVSSSRDSGYRKLSSVTTSRIGLSLYEAPQAVEVISGELLTD